MIDKKCKDARLKSDPEFTQWKDQKGYALK